MWNGSAWLNADEITGPYLGSGPVQFKINVTNTGNVDLTNLTVNDSKFGPISLGTSTLASGASTEAQYNLSWVSGQQNNTATVSGSYNGAKYNDSDSAYYYGSNSSIAVKKYVWDGIKWDDADTAPGPYLGTSPVQFKIVVTNTGNVDLSNISVDDNKYGQISLNNTTLVSGASTEAQYNMTWVSDQQNNTADRHPVITTELN